MFDKIFIALEAALSQLSANLADEQHNSHEKSKCIQRERIKHEARRAGALRLQELLKRFVGYVEGPTDPIVYNRYIEQLKIRAEQNWEQW